MNRPAVFLDCDGVLVEEVGHLHQQSALRLLSGAAPAVRRLNKAGYLTIVVTNQSAVARGLLDEEQLAAIHDQLRAELARAGAQLDDILYCAHHPTEGRPPYQRVCACRKPAPGLLFAAAQRHGIDLARSFLIGDKRSDIEAARRAGCGAWLVRTGHGATEAAAAFGPIDTPDVICADVYEAACRIAPDLRGLAGH